MADSSVFFKAELPNPTTWFYASGLLAVALFFKFSRVFSVRNLDILTLYLFAPGLLLIMEQRHALWGYVWLVCASLYFLARCLADLTFVRRPALGSNLDLSGLAWLAGALFVSLVAVAGRQPEQPRPDDPARPTDQIHRLGTKGIEAVAPDVDDSRLALWSGRALAVLCHLSVAVGLALIGWRHFEDVRSGMAMATFYLLLPYTFLLLPDSPVGVGRWDHAWPMALAVWTVFTYRRPVLAGAFLGVAAGTSPVMLVVVPAWLSLYRNRGATRFLVAFLAFAALAVAVLAGLLWSYEGRLPPSLRLDWLRLDWQPWKEPRAPFPGVWEGVHAGYRVPVFVASLALVIASAFWPAPKNLAHVLAMSAAALLSVQFWYADRGGVYVLWFLPLLVLLAFRPNLSAAQPPVPSGEDWLARLARALGGRLLRMLRKPEPVATPEGKVGGG